MSDLSIYVAIDIRSGQCVRLSQGKVNEMTVYSDDPVAMALEWVDQGATGLHVTDLDGAFSGKSLQIGMLERIVNMVDVPVSIGGGFRTKEDIDRAVQTGADTIVIGTGAIGDPYYMRGLAEVYGDKLSVAIDARDGFVQVNGWIENTNLKASDLASVVADCGIDTIMYTDASRDGMMRGADHRTTGEFCKNVRCNVVASGGISSPEDIRNLEGLGCDNLIGVVVGKALYEKQVTLADLKAI
jgi:phosphoribosylformimino-5-aminoimidazole carboxamide ribotide isomerase